MNEVTSKYFRRVNSFKKIVGFQTIWMCISSKNYSKKLNSQNTLKFLCPFKVFNQIVQALLWEWFQKIWSNFCKIVKKNGIKNP